MHFFPIPQIMIRSLIFFHNKFQLIPQFFFQLLFVVLFFFFLITLFFLFWPFVLLFLLYFIANFFGCFCVYVQKIRIFDHYFIVRKDKVGHRGLLVSLQINVFENRFLFLSYTLYKFLIKIIPIRVFELLIVYVEK